VIKDSVAGKFSGGTQRFGLKNQGVDYALDQYNDKLVSPEMRKQVDLLKKQILSGKLSVPDYYKKNGK
jgi:basic membrane protein A